MGDEKDMIDPSPVTPVEHLEARKGLEESLPKALFLETATRISERLKKGGDRSFRFISPDLDTNMGSILDKTAEMLKDHFERAGWEVSWYYECRSSRRIYLDPPGTRAKNWRILKIIGIVAAVIALTVGGIVAYPHVKAKLSVGAVSAQSNDELQALIKKGNFRYVDSDITTANFPDPPVGEASPPNGQAGIGVKTDFKLYHFDRLISSDDAIKEMEKEGYRPANLREFLRYTEKEWNGWDAVIALGQTWQGSYRYSYVPCAWNGRSGRGLSLDWFASGWSALYRFLAVRKDSPEAAH